MTDEEILRELRAVQHKFKDVFVCTGSTDIEGMVTDVLKHIGRLIAERDALGVRCAALRETLEKSEAWRKAYEEAKRKMYAQPGLLHDFAMANMPCNEGPLEREVRAVLSGERSDEGVEKMPELIEGGLRYGR